MGRKPPQYLRKPCNGGAKVERLRLKILTSSHHQNPPANPLFPCSKELFTFLSPAGPFSYDGSTTLRSFSAASSGQTVFTNRPDPSSKPVGMLVRGQISMCQ